MRRKLLFFLGTIVVLVGVGKGAILIANTMANEQAKEIERAKQIYINQYPKTKDSPSAVKLQELASQIGFLLVAKPELAKQFKISETDKNAFTAIQPELDKYIDAQVARPTDIAEVPPEKLRQYLRGKEATLAAIRTHILKSEIPQWSIDVSRIEKGDINYMMPSYLGMVNLQKLLALDAIEKNRLGQTKAMLETLETSWKLNQSLENRPELIDQVVNIKIIRIQAGTIRKLNNLPVEWQQRLLDRDYRKFMLNALEGEAFYSYAMLKKLKLSTELVEYPALNNTPNNTPFRQVSFWPVIKLLLSPIEGVYAHWMSIDINKVSRKRLSKLSQKNVCFSELDGSSEEQLAWWNFLGEMAVLFWPGQWEKAGRIMLELEMTQKVLQAKSEAAKTGKWPRSLPNLESSVCPGFKWIYQVSPDGEMSISFSPIPQWMKSEYPSDKRVELNYRDRQINRPKS